jgi:hypothetical protein
MIAACFEEAMRDETHAAWSSDEKQSAPAHRHLLN